jgi:DNA-directed RNA polymerase specialized sigma24 family protein
MHLQDSPFGAMRAFKRTAEKEQTEMFTEETATQRWTLTQGAFDHLLARLDSDRENAGRAYEKLRDYLIKFFMPQAPLDAEQWADTVLDRVARRNEEMEISNITAFAWGVARLVRTEVFRATRKHVELENQPEPHQMPKTEDEIDLAQRSERLGRVVNKLPTSDVKLLMCWYSSCEKAAQRQQLAVSLGVSVTSLRVRAHRARVRVRRMALAEGYRR